MERVQYLVEEIKNFNDEVLFDNCTFYRGYLSNYDK